MPRSDEVTSRRRSPLSLFTEEDLEYIRLDTLYRKRPDQYTDRMACLKGENRKAYDREMKKRNLETSTGESKAPPPARVKKGPFIRRLEGVPEDEPSGTRLFKYPDARRVFYKVPGGPAKNALIASEDRPTEGEEDEEEEDTEWIEDALFIKRKKSKKAPKTIRKPEPEYQIKCAHCKSYQLVPRSQIRKISQQDEQEDSTSTF